jgi:hypothetical protein
MAIAETAVVWVCATHATFDRDGVAKRAGWIDGEHRFPVEWTAGALKVPPGDAVDERSDQGARADQRSERRQQCGQALRLGGDEDDVLDAEIRLLAGTQAGNDTQPREVGAQSVPAQLRQPLAAGQEADGVSRGMQTCGQHRAHRTHPRDANTRHGQAAFLCCTAVKASTKRSTCSSARPAILIRPECAM